MKRQVAAGLPQPHHGSALLSRRALHPQGAHHPDVDSSLRQSVWQGVDIEPGQVGMVWATCKPPMAL